MKVRLFDKTAKTLDIKIQKYTTGIEEWKPKKGSVSIKMPIGKNSWIYLLLVIKGRKEATAIIGVKFEGKPIKRLKIRQSIIKADDFKNSNKIFLLNS